MTERSPGPRELHPASLSRREALLFEAGVKLGAVFHQYLGTPVSPTTAASLARTIGRAVRLQPYVRSVVVHIDAGRRGRRGPFGYRYLTAEMLAVDVTLSDGEVTVRARLAHRPRLRYPLMTVESVTEGRRPTPGRRPARTSGPSRRRTGPSAE